MKYLTTNEIRKIWLDFWKEKDHLELESKSLVPINDDSLLFINSGVATLKPYLSGLEVPPSRRITNSQKSLRTNDIENVGITARHHTLFEMLGNFSIGDYFKKEAINYAYELITSKKYYGLDIEKIYITVHPNDNDSLKYWLELGIKDSKIIKTFDNFWEIGKGPGGPNTEIFYDRGSKYDTRDPYILLKDDLETDRVIEIWNIVFSQYNCDPDIPQEKYKELPQKNIDTGMGLERMACIMQEVETNFETDNFKIIMDEIQNVTNTKYKDYKKAYRIIADHIRALTFTISDGVFPSSEGRGYVIRRLLRRAVKYAYIDLNIKKPFLYNLVDCVIVQMQEYYPYLEKRKELIKSIIKKEEEKFFQTIKDGFKYYNLYLKEVEDGIFPAKYAFKLYDTYGFPYELTKELLEEKNFSINEEEYYIYLEEQRQRARTARQDVTTIHTQNSFLSNINLQSEFVGYKILKLDAKIIFLTDGNQELKEIKKGDRGFIILDKTPFYATSGGQETDVGKSDKFEVINVIKLPQGNHLHEVYAKDNLSLNLSVKVEVDFQKREATQKNHSATHLLHYALNKVLGDNVEQAGSYQDDLKTRFDFTTHNQIQKQDLIKVQDIVNQEIQKASKTKIQNMELKEAVSLGAKALFEEKYQENVRVVTLGDSIELCGGTHVENTKDIEKFYIKSEQSIGSGIHRIEALTGANIKEYQKSIIKKLEQEIKIRENNLKEGKIIKFDEIEQNLTILNSLNRVQELDLKKFIDKIDKLKKDNEKIQKKIADEKEMLLKQIYENLIKKVTVINNIKKIDEELKDITSRDLKELSDKLTNKLGSSIVILRLIEDKKLTVVIKVSKEISSEYNAGKMIKQILEPLDGRGGGSATMAQGGATLK